MGKRLFIISNRLPINVDTADNKVKVNVSSGGLITAISSYINASTKEGNQYSEHYWIGVPCCTPAEWSKASSLIEKKDFDYLPVFINPKVYDLYYNGLSNSVIWPIFHYFPSYAEYKTEYYDNYIKANEDFLDVVARHVKEGDVIWLHDYHLLPLAGMIRKQFPTITIGFFLHIPYPSFELFRMMPAQWQHQMLEGLLGADLIGFHTIDYAAHFLKCVQETLGLEAENNVVKYKNRLVKIDFFPISIDYNKFNTGFDSTNVTALRGYYQQQFPGKKILFSVDRLDYTKGIFSRLKAYEHFLKTYPEYVGNVVYIMVLVPSRDTITKYAERKKEIDEYIGNLNSTIGNITWKPVIYQYNHLAFDHLLALYTACDMALITPLRDGMNLVAKEFVASRKDQQGVLLLSEMTGAARELTEAILINPNDIISVGAGIKKGLEMSKTEQARRLSTMQKRISAYNVNTWAEDFFTQLGAIKSKQKDFEFMFLDRDSKMSLYQEYQNASKRLLLLDYDGTLVPYATLPEDAKPTASLLSLLQQLAKDERNEIYIISGRDSSTLQSWLGDVGANLIAEHGAKAKLPGKAWEIDSHIHIDDDWKDIIISIMKHYVTRCPNTFIEEKEFSVVWHYRNAESGQAKIRANELYAELLQATHHRNLQVQGGNRIMEVRVKGIDKGYIVRKLLKDNDYNFILACGDDYTDEDMFKVLAPNKEAFTIKIGDAASYAKYNLYTSQMMVSLLTYLQGSLP